MIEKCPKLVPALIEVLNEHGYRDPTTVDVMPHALSRENGCWINVPRLIRDEGGEMLSGRIVWTDSKGYYLHLEAHAVWRRPDGSIIDPTPKPDGETEIVFVPEVLEFRDRMIPSVYIATDSSPKVLELIEKMNEVQRIRASVPADVQRPLTKAEAQTFAELEIMTAELYLFG